MIWATEWYVDFCFHVHLQKCVHKSYLAQNDWWKMFGSSMRRLRWYWRILKRLLAVSISTSLLLSILTTPSESISGSGNCAEQGQRLVDSARFGSLTKYKLLRSQEHSTMIHSGSVSILVFRKIYVVFLQKRLQRLQTSHLFRLAICLAVRQLRW